MFIDIDLGTSSVFFKRDIMFGEISTRRRKKLIIK